MSSKRRSLFLRLLAVAWALPNTLLGLPLVGLALLSGGRARVLDGALEAHGRIPAWLLRLAPLSPGGVAALTLGHVVLGRDEACLNSCRAHERAHVRQYEVWGPLFLPAYAASGAFAFLRGRHAYRDNPFERAAARREAP